MKVIVLEVSGPITQEELESVLQLDSQLESLRITRDRIAAGVVARLTAGAAAEPGSRTCRLDESYAGKVRRQRLVVR